MKHTTSPRITFYLPKLSDPAEYEGIDPDTEWSRFKNARAMWIPHTYVRLRHAGHNVLIDNRPPGSGIAVVFAGDMRRFLSQAPRRRRPLIVCAQADRLVPEADLADVIVQHNGLRANGRRRFFIPNWPQGGLIRRDPSREASVRTISYKGNPENLHEAFLSPQWERFLENRGIQFVVDADMHEDDPRLTVDSFITFGSATRWNDYSDSDATLSVRPHSRDLYRHKPAVKLVNAWRAGVPALLGPEHAFRELRRSDLDYMEVSSVSEAMEAVDGLANDPGLYNDIVENGVERGRDFSVESIRRRWESLLFSTLSGWQSRMFVRLSTPLTVPVRRVGRGIRRRIRF